MTEEKPIDFENSDQRNAWIIKHAEYFTTCRRIRMKLIRAEHRTIEEARKHAGELLKEDNSKPVLIYAVSGNSDTYVEMVK